MQSIGRIYSARVKHMGGAGHYCFVAHLDGRLIFSAGPMTMREKREFMMLYRCNGFETGKVKNYA